MGKKGKLTVGKFVQVMTGGMVVLDDGDSSPRAKAYASAQRLEEMQASLTQLAVPCAELKTSIEAYYLGVNQALQVADKKQQDQKFVDLEEQTKKAESAAAVFFPGYLAQAQHQQSLIEALARQCRAMQDSLAKVTRTDVLALLSARLKSLNDRLANARKPLRDATELSKSLKALDGLQVVMNDADFDRYVDVAMKLDKLAAEVTAAIDLKASRVAQLPKSALRKILDNMLAAFKARLLRLAQVSDLLDLVAKFQDMGDVGDEVRRLDIAQAQTLAKQYQDLVGQLLFSVQEKSRAGAALPSANLQASAASSLTELQNKLVPIDQATSLNDLADKLKATKELETELEAFDVAAYQAQAQAYQDLLAKEQLSFDTKTKEAAGIPVTMIRDPMKASLAALHGQRVPLDQVASLDDLGAKSTALKDIVSKLDAFDIARYGPMAQQYQDMVVELLSLFQGKAREIAALAEPTLQTLLSAKLDEMNATMPPLDQIESMGAIESKLKVLAALPEQLKKFDIAVYPPMLKEHAKLLADLPAEIDARVTQIAGHLGAGEQATLRAEYIDQIEKWRPVTTAGSLKGQIEGLQALKAAVAARVIAVPSADQKKRFVRADARLASAKNLLAGLPTEALRKASGDALDYLEKSLNQMKLGSKAQGLPGSLNVGKTQASGHANYTLQESELTRALDSVLKALNQAMSDPASVDAKLLEFEGGKDFAAGLCKMNATMVAFGASHKGISPAEALAIHRYTGDDYGPMNRQRRGIEQDPRLEFLNKTCDQALSKMPEYPDVAWPTFRAESAWSQDVVDRRYARGRQFVCGVLWSTGARGVADLSKGAPKFTHVIYGKKGKDVAALSANPGEGSLQQAGYELKAMSGRGEVLFPADSTFFVSARVDPEGGPEAIKYSPDAYGPRITTTLKEVLNG